MLESIHADLVSAPCSRYGEGKAVHLEVRSHAERGGDTQFHNLSLIHISALLVMIGFSEEVVLSATTNKIIRLGLL